MNWDVTVWSNRKLNRTFLRRVLQNTPAQLCLRSLSLSRPRSPLTRRAPPPPLFPASGAALRQRSVGPSPGLGGAFLRRRASHGYAVPYPCLLPPSLPSVRGRSSRTRPDPRRPPAMKNPLLLFSLSLCRCWRPPARHEDSCNPLDLGCLFNFSPCTLLDPDRLWQFSRRALTDGMPIWCFGLFATCFRELFLRLVLFRVTLVPCLLFFFLYWTLRCDAYSVLVLVCLLHTVVVNEPVIMFLHLSQIVCREYGWLSISLYLLFVHVVRRQDLESLWSVLYSSYTVSCETSDPHSVCCWCYVQNIYHSISGIFDWGCITGSK
jgi:hypothetical protein